MGNIPSGIFPQGQARGPFVPRPPFGQQGFGPQHGQFQGYPSGGPPQANITPPPYGQPGLDHANIGFPQQGYAAQSYPPQGYPSQNYPPQDSPQGYPPQGYPPQSYSPQGYPHQGYPPQGPPTGYPSQGLQPGLGEAACCGACAACLTCLLCSCCNALMGSGMHSEGEGEGLPPTSAAVTPPAAPQADEHDD